MRHLFFEKIIEIPNLIFEELDWRNEDFENLEKDLHLLEKGFRDEISQNLFGKSELVKKDLIKLYINEISEIYHNYLLAKFEIDESDSIRLVEIFKSFFQDIIDVICLDCVKYSIDLEYIISNSLTSSSILNFDVYNEVLRSSLIKKSKSEEVLRNSFINSEAYDFFVFLHKNFYNKSELTKYSCIYTKMIADKFLDVSIKPTHFKQLISKSPFNVDFKHSLKANHLIPSSAIKEYEKKKEEFLKSLENR